MRKPPITVSVKLGPAQYVKSEGEEGGGESTTMDMRMDFFDFGFEPEIDVPESDEVFDATDLGKEAAGLPTDR